MTASSVRVPALTCAVLVGGSGRRFGGDKLTAPLGGRRVVDHTLAAVTGLGDDVLLVGAGADRIRVPGARAVPDAQPRRPHSGGPIGPLAGIVAALETASTQLVAVVAADMPLASATLLRGLALRWDGEAAVLPRHAGRPQPLHAVYATGHRTAFRAALEAGERSPLTVARQLGAQVVDVDDDGWDLDVDTPDDLHAAEEQIRRR